MKKLLILICLSLVAFSINAQWKYSTKKDEMSDEKIYEASLRCNNIRYFDFPYHGGSRLFLYIRNHPRWGTDVYIWLSNGQLLDKNIVVRFDNSSAETYYTNEPADYSSDTLFISDEKEFIEKAKKAKRIKIQVPIYNEGNVVFTFNTNTPLIWEH